MNVKKLLVSGIAAGVVMAVIGMIAGTLTSGLYLETAHLWKPMGTTWYYQMIVLDIVVGILFAYAYTWVNAALPGEGAKKGLLFGFLVWLVASIPGMGMTYMSMTVPTMLVGLWLLSALIQYPLMGAVIAVLYEKV